MCGESAICVQHHDQNMAPHGRQAQTNLPTPISFPFLKYLQCLGGVCVFPDLLLWHHPDCQGYTVCLTLIVSIFFGGGGMSTGQKGGAFCFVFLLYSSLLPLLRVFSSSHCNGEECLLDSIKPSKHSLPLRSLLIYVNILIILWDPYHPFPQFSVFVFKQKSNQLSHISAPIPSSLILNSSYCSWMVYRKSRFLPFQLFQTCEEAASCAEKSLVFVRKTPPINNYVFLLNGDINISSQRAMGIKYSVMHGKYLVQHPQHIFFPLSLSLSLSDTERQSVLLALSPFL